MPGFLIPYAFFADQAVLLQGDLIHAAGVIATASLGVIALSAATGGYLLGPLSMTARALLFCFAPLLIDPRISSDLIGGAGLIAVSAYQYRRYRLAKPSAERAGMLGSAGALLAANEDDTGVANLRWNGCKWQQLCLHTLNRS